MIRTANRRAHRGASVVETAVALSLFLLVLFAIFEFGRFVMARHILKNAAREGARKAVVNTERLVTADIEAIVTSRLMEQLSSPSVQVYRADPATGCNIGPWTDAGLGECIAVEVTASYVPLLPVSGILPASGSISSKSVMRSEAN